jgi:hypothetical protein
MSGNIASPGQSINIIHTMILPSSSALNSGSIWVSATRCRLRAVFVAPRHQLAGDLISSLDQFVSHRDIGLMSALKQKQKLGS